MSCDYEEHKAMFRHMTELLNCNGVFKCVRDLDAKRKAYERKLFMSAVVHHRNASGKHPERLMHLKKPAEIHGTLQRAIKLSEKIRHQNNILNEMNKQMEENIRAARNVAFDGKITVDMIRQASEMMQKASSDYSCPYFAVINKSREQQYRGYGDFVPVEEYRHKVLETYRGEIGSVKTLFGTMRVIVADGAPKECDYMVREKAVIAHQDWKDKLK